ncbi:MAG TPA: OsmC family protein [Verrucomicrobiae bacterium]|nr:OsmC family protein [Verrucomicrobiae bacterium]
MVEIEIEYQGDLRCTARHGPSGAALDTDAPLDNQGKGAAFSPTDLLATSLGVCMMTTMGIYARRHGVELAGARVHVTKEMIADPDRRVGRLGVTIDLPTKIDPNQRAPLERSAITCPVAKSLHPAVRVETLFRYGA